jgi:hypothetical protein
MKACDQGVDLIAHERDERRDDDRRSGQHQCRQLITQRLTRAGRHDGQGIAAGQQMLDDRALARTKIGMTEVVS